MVEEKTNNQMYAAMDTQSIRALLTQSKKDFQDAGCNCSKGDTFSKWRDQYFAISSARLDAGKDMDDFDDLAPPEFPSMELTIPGLK